MRKIINILFALKFVHLTVILYNKLTLFNNLLGNDSKTFKMILPSDKNR